MRSKFLFSPTMSPSAMPSNGTTTTRFPSLPTLPSDEALLHGPISRPMTSLKVTLKNTCPDSKVKLSMRIWSWWINWTRLLLEREWKAARLLWLGSWACRTMWVTCQVLFWCRITDRNFTDYPDSRIIKPKASGWEHSVDQRGIDFRGEERDQWLFGCFWSPRY